MRVIFTFFSELFLCRFFFCSEKKKVISKRDTCELQPEMEWEHLGIEAALGTSWVFFGHGFFSLGSSPLTLCLPLTLCFASPKPLPAPGPSEPHLPETYPATIMPPSDYFRLWIYLSPHFPEGDGLSLSQEAVACVISQVYRIR